MGFDLVEEHVQQQQDIVPAPDIDRQQRRLDAQPLQQGTDITAQVLNDRAATLRWLDAYLQELTELRRLIQSGDKDMLELTLGNLLVQRERWLRERAENEWAEGVETKIDRPSVGDQFLGGWLGGKLKKDKREE